MNSGNRGLPKKRLMRHDRHFVDELAQRMGEGIGRMVRVTNIVSNQDQPRTSLGDFSDLVRSIQKHGVLEPLLVRKGERGQYELVSGERRFHAAMQAELTEVPCIELQVSDSHALEIALIENLQRQNEKLIKALRFYADASNIRIVSMIDRGQIAREVLRI